MKKRVLFVDDEPNVIDGLKRMLRVKFKSDEWELFFAGSGAEGLRLLKSQPVDVVVSDMIMPQMNGAQFLTEVMKLYPQTVRFVLSGHSDREMIMRSIGCAHQYLSKPCDAAVLANTILRAFSLRNILESDNVKKLVSQLKALPALPDLYARVMAELRTRDASAQKVGEIISKDLAMSAKVLHLINSAFFGLRRRVESPGQAVALLGLDVIKSMVLMIGVFEQKHTGNKEGVSIDWLWNHSLQVGRFSQSIAKSRGMDKKSVDETFMAGLFHDLGKLILIANLPEEYGRAMSLVAEKGLSILDAELQVFEATHAEVGGYLLGLWAFPDTLVDSAIHHHHPSRSHFGEFSSLSAVHIANVFAGELQVPGVVQDKPLFDVEYLAKLNVMDSLDGWRKMCVGLGQKEDDNV